MKVPFIPDDRLKRISVAILLSIIIAIPISYYIDTSESGFLKRGDFPGFYVQGVIKARDQMQNLYDPELQRKIENEFWPSFNGGFYMAAYPPYDATLLYLFALLPPKSAQIVFISIMLGFFIVSVWITSKSNPSISDTLFPVTVLSLSFAPIFYGVLGAQNTALSMLLYAAAIYFLKSPTKLRQMLAGLSIGLWLVKPQFAVLLIAFTFVSGLRWLVLGCLIPASIFFIIAAMDMGIIWPITWITSVSQFAEQNYISNAPQMASINGTIRAIAMFIGLDPKSSALGIIGIATSCLTVVIAVYFFSLTWKFRKHQSEFQHRMILAGALIVLLSPQTLFYDLGIAYISLLHLLDFKKNSSVVLLMALCIVFAPLVYFRELLPFPLFFLFPVAIIIWQGFSKNKKEEATSSV